MKKNDFGITLVGLVITIIILLILASITVYSGVSTIRSAKLTKFTTELKMMQQKVNELYDSYKNERLVTGIQDIGKNPEENFSTNFDAYNKLALAKTNDTYSANIAASNNSEVSIFSQQETTNPINQGITSLNESFSEVLA